LRFRFLFVALYITTVLLFTVYIRNAENHTFYRLCSLKAEQARLKQQIGEKQLRLAGLINPAAVSQILYRQNVSDSTNTNSKSALDESEN